MLEDLISADGFIFTNEIEKKLHKEKPVSRKHVIMMTVKSVDKFRDKAHVLLCMMSHQVDGSDMCSFDIMCTARAEPEPPLEDLDAILYYRDLLVQFQPLLQNVTLYETKFDRGTVYDELCKMSATFISLMSTLEYAAKSFIEMGAMEPKNETVPDMFFPFPSNDRCVVLDKLTKDKQVFRAMKSIWLFSNYMRAGLTERITLYQAANMLEGIEKVVHKVSARRRDRIMKKRNRLIEMLDNAFTR